MIYAANFNNEQLTKKLDSDYCDDGVSVFLIFVFSQPHLLFCFLHQPPFGRCLLVISGVPEGFCPHFKIELAKLVKWNLSN